MQLNGIKRRQLFNDLFEFINNNKCKFNVNIFNELEIKLMCLWIANEQSYKICKYWKRDGICPNRSKCPFQHFTLVKHNQQCYFNQNGTCNRGNDCYYIHNHNDNPFNLNHKFNKETDLPIIPPSIVTISQHWDTSLSSQDCAHNHDHNHGHNHSHSQTHHNNSIHHKDINNNLNISNNNNNQCINSLISSPGSQSGNLATPTSPTSSNNIISHASKSGNLTPIKETLSILSKASDADTNNNDMEKKENIFIPEENKESFEKKENIKENTELFSDSINNTKENIEELSPTISTATEISNNSSVSSINTHHVNETHSDTHETPNPNIIPVLNNIENDMIETSPDDLEVSSASTVSTVNTGDMEDTDSIDDINIFDELIDMFDDAMELIVAKCYNKAWNRLNILLNDERFKMAIKYHDFLLESYLMMSFLHKNIGNYQQAINILEIENSIVFPQDLKKSVNREREILYKLLYPDKQFYTKF